MKLRPHPILLISCRFLALAMSRHVVMMVRASSSSRSNTGNYGSSTLSIPTCFVPCGAPRFDAFAEKLVCSWTDENNQKVGVDEVMRSCGGAVQGIREHILSPTLPVVDDDNDNDDAKKLHYHQGLYLNRADDGFVFFDSGAYSLGPTSFLQDPARHNERWVSNFMIDSTRRLILTSSTPSVLLTPTTESPSVTPSLSKTTFMLQKTVGGGLDREVPTVTMDTTGSWQRVCVAWDETLSCSMPGGGQPWNLLRAKWAKRRTDSINTVSRGSRQELSSTFVCWASTDQTVKDFADWAGLSPSDLGIASIDDVENGSLLLTGVHGPPDGKIQGMARIYTKSGTLSNILFLQGTVQG
jgi:hypothetical protein